MVENTTGRMLYEFVQITILRIDFQLSYFITHLISEMIPPEYYDVREFIQVSFFGAFHL